MHAANYRHVILGWLPGRCLFVSHYRPVGGEDKKMILARQNESHIRATLKIPVTNLMVAWIAVTLLSL